jgi:4-hydroxybenzoyl-CoA reductase subunit beta
MNRFKLINVRSLQEASRFIKDHPAGDAVLMAGGTDLLVLRRNGLIQPQFVVRVDSNPERCGCHKTGDGGMFIGAFATLDDLAQHPLVRKNYPMLAQAAGAVASPQIRHKGTLGGNVCLNTRCWFFNKSAFWRREYPRCRKAFGGDTCYVVPESRKGCFALQSGDTVGPLVALDAKLRLVSDKGERLVDISDFYLGDGIRNLDLEPGEILSAVVLPPPRTEGVFIKFRPQNNIDFATFTLSVMLSIDDTGSRIVAGSVSTRPLRAKKAEEMLNRGQGDAGGVAIQAAKELRIVSFVRGGVEFKRQVIEAGLKKALNQQGLNSI